MKNSHFGSLWVLVWNLGSFPGEIQSWPLYTELRGRLKDKEGPSTLVDGSFNKQGNLHMRQSWAPQDEQISSVSKFTEALTGFTHIFSLTTVTLSRLHPWNGPSVGMVGRAYIPRTRGRCEESPIVWVQVSGHLVVISSQWPPPTGSFI